MKVRLNYSKGNPRIIDTDLVFQYDLERDSKFGYVQGIKQRMEEDVINYLAASMILRKPIVLVRKDPKRKGDRILEDIISMENVESITPVIEDATTERSTSSS